MTLSAGFKSRAKMYFKFIIIILVLPLKLVQGDDSNERDKDLVLFNNFWNVNDKVNKSGIDGINKVDNGLNITGALKWDTIIDMVSDLFDFEDQSTNETTVAGENYRSYSYNFHSNIKRQYLKTIFHSYSIKTIFFSLEDINNLKK